MPEVLVRGDDERGLVVVVEGTQAEEIGAVGFEYHPGGIDQGDEGRFTL